MVRSWLVLVVVVFGGSIRLESISRCKHAERVHRDVFAIKFDHDSRYRREKEIRRHARLMIRKNDNSSGRYRRSVLPFPKRVVGRFTRARGRVNLSLHRGLVNKPGSRIDSPTTRPTSSNLPIPREERTRKPRLNYDSVASPLEIEQDFSPPPLDFSSFSPIFPVNESDPEERKGR